MNYRVIITLCGVIIFILSSVFAAVTSYMFDVTPWVVYLFFLSEAVIVFIVTDLFIRSYYNNLHNNLRNMLKGAKYDKTIESNEVIRSVIDSINDERQANQDKITALKQEMGDIGESFYRIKELIIQKMEISDRLTENAKKLADYFKSSIRSFDKIKSIGLEIKTTSKSIDEETNKVLRDARKQSELAGRGVKAIGKEIQGINELKNSIMSSTKIIQELMEMSKQITSFVARIAEMAKKTNLLALNAGIEAARAGEAGKSFSVVADEIKMLSTNSNKSAEEISDILRNIKQGTEEVIEMIRVTEKLEENISTFYKTGDIFIDIVKDVKDVEKVISNITGYTQDHNTDAELMFKILSDSSSRGEGYIKTSESMTVSVEQMNAENQRLISAVDTLIERTNKLKT